MPATVKHIETNFARVDGGSDPELKKLLAEAKSRVKTEQPNAEETTVVHAVWAYFVTLADKVKMADKIPGTVGRTYAKKYGTIQARPPRGTKVEVPLSPAALSAVSMYRKDSDQFKVEDGTLSFTNRRGAVKAVDAMIKRAHSDIKSDAKDIAGRATSLRALKKKIDV